MPGMFAVCEKMSGRILQCPSQCIQISDVDRQRPFYRIDENIRFTENFLQVEATSEDLTKEEWEYARKDVSMTLTALAKAIQQVFGNGTEAIAFHAGALAAPHFPEVYEVKEPEEKLQRLRQRLRHCFDFDFQKDGDNLEFTFTSCGIHHVVQDAGNEKVGDALLCHLFHDFWTSLVGSYCDVEYNYKTEEIGTQCKLVLSPLA
jgi:hypothetical protein